jgi:hypothetical protein
MNPFQKGIFYAVCVSIAILGLSSAMIKADYFIKFDNGQGFTKIVHSSDRDCRVANLPAGNYTLTVCDEKGNDLHLGAQFVYSSQTAREAAKGLAGKAPESKILKITENSNKSANQISIAESGSTFSCKAIVLPYELDKSNNNITSLSSTKN